MTHKPSKAKCCCERVDCAIHQSKYDCQSGLSSIAARSYGEPPRKSPFDAGSATAVRAP